MTWRRGIGSEPPWPPEAGREGPGATTMMNQLAWGSVVGQNDLHWAPIAAKITARRPGGAYVWATSPQPI
jgi:hypothetical protein